MTSALFGLVKALTELPGPVGQEGRVLDYVEQLWRVPLAERASDLTLACTVMNFRHIHGRQVQPCSSVTTLNFHVNGAKLPN